MATLDELVVRITADPSGLDRALKQANATVQGSTSRMTGAFAGLVRQVGLDLTPLLERDLLAGLADQGPD